MARGGLGALFRLAGGTSNLQLAGARMDLMAAGFDSPSWYSLTLKRFVCDVLLNLSFNPFARRIIQPVRTSLSTWHPPANNRPFLTVSKRQL